MKLKLRVSVNMRNVKMFKLLGVFLALMLIVWGIAPILRHQPLTNDVIATAVIFVLIAIAYLIIMFNPSWTKAVFFFEGIVIGVVGYTILAFPYNIGFAIIGFIIIIIAVLAYTMKLPKGILKFFYR